MAPESHRSLSPLQQWNLLLRTHSRIQRTKILEAVNRSRLKSLTILIFLGIYMISAYGLLNRGFGFVAGLPAAGSLIADRLIHVVFFCFMIMLVFSSAVTAYISVYRGRDTGWLLSLPVSHRITFLWKCFESALFSTWGLLIIIAPLLVSFARQRDVSLEFYLKSVAALIPFLVICSSLGSICLIVVGRFLNRRQFAVIAVAAGILVVGSMIHTAWTDKKIVEESGLSAALTFQRVLSHTNLATNRAIPSTWLASSIVDWSHPYSYGGNWLMPSLLLSHALVLPLFLAFLARIWFYPSWNRSIQSNAISSNRRSRALAGRREERPDPFVFRCLSRVMGRPMGAVAKKDFLTFVREPAQWVQFTLVFGLLLIYASGLNRIHDQLGEPRDLYLVAFLNLTVSALALSTLTTRFVFPQFSLEGRRLWILTMSPVRLTSIVIQKFLTSALMTGGVVALILLVSSRNLRFGPADTLFFSLSIFLLATGLNALAVGLGVIFPNLRESNTAKIVSGFGGTLCLVASFVYIVVFVLVMVMIRSEVFYRNVVSEDWIISQRSLLGFAGLVALTLLATGFPLYFSIKKLKNPSFVSNF